MQSLSLDEDSLLRWRTARLQEASRRRAFSFYYFEVNFRPATETISNTKKNT
jgi:hypothetical protein